MMHRCGVLLLCKLARAISGQTLAAQVSVLEKWRVFGLLSFPLWTMELGGSGGYCSSVCYELCHSVKSLEARGFHDQLRLLVSRDRGESDASARGASTSATVVVAPQL